MLRCPLWVETRQCPWVILVKLSDRVKPMSRPVLDQEPSQGYSRTTAEVSRSPLLLLLARFGSRADISGPGHASPADPKQPL